MGSNILTIINKKNMTTQNSNNIVKIFILFFNLKF